MKPGETPAGGVGRGVRPQRSSGRARSASDGARAGRRRWAGCTSSAPSGTSRAASTTSCAAARAARATRARRASILSLDDDLMRIFGGDRLKAAMKRLGMEEDVPIESPMVIAGDRARAEAGRAAQLRDPQAPARVRRRHQQAAQARSTACAASCSRARSRSEYVLRQGARDPGRAWSQDHLASPDAAEWRQVESFRQQVAPLLRRRPRGGGRASSRSALRRQIAETSVAAPRGALRGEGGEGRRRS